MEILIKRKNYKKVVEFLHDNTPDSDWKIFLDNLKINNELVEFTKDFLNHHKNVFTLKLFFVQIFSLNNKDLKYQEIVYDIITTFLSSNNELSSHIFIRNLLLAQTVKLCILNKNFREKLIELVPQLDLEVNDKWFCVLLDEFGFYEELAIFYDQNNNENKCIEYYQKAGMSEKVEEIKNKLKKNFEEEYNGEEDNNLKYENENSCLNI